MRYQFIKEHEKQFRLWLMCRVLEVSRGGYYAFRKRPESERTKENEKFLAKIKDAHKKSNKTYVSPRIHRQLMKEGIMCSRG